MKYLHTRLLALCLCITLFFSSCGIYTAESSQQDFISSAENPETIQEAPLSTETPLSSSQMNIISSHNGIIASGMVGNKNGCYEVLYRPVGDGNILYTDYASKSRIYLSSRITGEHNNESDSSWLKSTVGGCYFSLTSEYLILFKLNTPAFADSETDMQRGYIAKYDLDGSNRQILTWLAPNETIADGCIASDSENLYYLNYFVQEDGNSSPLSLIQLNITSGEKDEICQLSQNARHFIVGTYQDKIVIKNILNPITITEDLSSEDIVNALLRKIGRQGSPHKGKACQVPAILPFGVVERNSECSKGVWFFQRLPKDILSLQNQPIFEIVESVIRCTAVDDTGRGNQLRAVCYPAVFLPRAVEAD